MRLRPLFCNVEFATEPEVLLPGDDGYVDPRIEWEKHLEREARARRARRAARRRRASEAKTPTTSISVTDNGSEPKEP